MKRISQSLSSARSRSSGFSDFDEDNPSTKNASKFRRKQFRKIFTSVSSSEQIHDSFSCALVDDILLQGMLYVSAHHVCFHSNIFGRETKLTIHLDSVRCITKEKTAIIFPNAIAVHQKHGRKYVFGSFLARDSAFRLLSKIFHRHREFARNSTSKSESKTNSIRRSRSNEASIRFHQETEFVDDDEEDEDDNDDDNDDDINSSDNEDDDAFLSDNEGDPEDSEPGGSDSNRKKLKKSRGSIRSSLLLPSLTDSMATTTTTKAKTISRLQNFTVPDSCDKTFDKANSPSTKLDQNRIWIGTLSSLLSSLWYSTHRSRNCAIVIVVVAVIVALLVALHQLLRVHHLISGIETIHNDNNDNDNDKVRGKLCQMVEDRGDDIERIRAWRTKMDSVIDRLHLAIENVNQKISSTADSDKQ